MKLIVVLLAERQLKPRNVIASANMVLFDVFAFATNNANLLKAATGFHDRAPTAE